MIKKNTKMTSNLTNNSVNSAIKNIHKRHQKEYAKLISRYQIMCETGGACTVDAQIYRKIFKNGKQLLKGIEFLNLCDDIDLEGATLKYTLELAVNDIVYFNFNKDILRGRIISLPLGNRKYHIQTRNHIYFVKWENIFYDNGLVHKLYKSIEKMKQFI